MNFLKHVQIHITEFSNPMGPLQNRNIVFCLSLILKNRKKKVLGSLKRSPEYMTTCSKGNEKFLQTFTQDTQMIDSCISF